MDRHKEPGATDCDHEDNTAWINNCLTVGSFCLTTVLAFSSRCLFAIIELQEQNIYLYNKTYICKYRPVETQQSILMTFQL